MGKLKIIGVKILNGFYNLPRILIINFYKLFLWIKIINPKKIPYNKSAIFAFNHTTGADPLIALGALRKKIVFVTDSERFSNRFTSFFFRKFTNSIPIFKEQFNKNIKSFKELFLISDSKKVFFGIFPEGELYKHDEFGKFRGGAAYLSYKTKLPIIPVYLHNLSKGPGEDTWLGRHPVAEGIMSILMNTFRKVHVFIGEPIDPVAENIMKDLKELADKNAYKKAIQRITQELEEEFQELREEADKLFSGKKPKTAMQIQTNNPAGSTEDTFEEDEYNDENLFGDTIDDNDIISLSS
ncbi:MAG: 1-acyl-sn-glycerol-3-phosphate acyltransferase, partial [Actinobacteria bacterium]|nr:1-acyl-sn-glycerol-3-phosphate acyltransferase [Actinomycetota bacterium]